VNSLCGQQTAQGGSGPPVRTSTPDVQTKERKILFTGESERKTRGPRTAVHPRSVKEEEIKGGCKTPLIRVQSYAIGHARDQGRRTKKKIPARSPIPRKGIAKLVWGKGKPSVQRPPSVRGRTRKEEREPKSGKTPGQGLFR